MKQIKSTITYTVPHWNFCNNDASLLPKEPTCRFCVKTKAGHRCALYDEALATDGSLVTKTKRCCDATVDRSSTVLEQAPSQPIATSPKELIKSTIDMYEKTVKELRAQGYPQPMAEQVARKHLLGG